MAAPTGGSWEDDVREFAGLLHQFADKLDDEAAKGHLDCAFSAVAGLNQASGVLALALHGSKQLQAQQRRQN